MRSTSSCVRLAVFTAATLCSLLPLGAEDERRATVGFPARIDQIVLPGTELEAKPLADDQVAIVLRLVAAFPHGTAFRYDIEYYGLEPGVFELKDYLQRKDRSSTAGQPSISVEIETVLPPGQVQPNAVGPKSSPFLRGYWMTITLAATVWLVGLVAIVCWIRAEHARKTEDAASSRHQQSLADRLRPVVQDAIAGKTSQSQLAELERMLLAFWRRRLGLDQISAAEAVAVLREHPEVGALLDQLEVWLHRPGRGGEVDVAALLQPYENLPPDAIEAPNS